LDQALVAEEEYLAKGIQITFAGDFNEAIPTNEQLHAGGRLIAMLMERYPHLRTEQIKGVRDFIPTPSPGDQWNDGQRWREMLLAAVRRTRGMVEPSEMETQLRVKTAQLEHELQVAQRSNQLLQEQKARLQTEYQRLQTQAASHQILTEAKRHGLGLVITISSMRTAQLTKPISWKLPPFMSTGTISIRRGLSLRAAL
jgi:hypothetical protein